MDQMDTTPLLLALLVPALALPHVANAAGWLFTEMGRQPWIVFGLLKTADAVSPNVSAAEVAFSLGLFTLLYGALLVADFYLLAKFARAGVAAVALHHEDEPAAVPAEA